MLGVALVLLANIFHELVTRQEAVPGVNREGPGVGAGIGDGDFLGDESELGTRVALDGTELFGVQNRSLKPTVSMTSVSLSQRPVEWPYQVGFGSAGCARPSMKIWR